MKVITVHRALVLADGQHSITACAPKARTLFSLSLSEAEDGHTLVSPQYKLKAPHSVGGVDRHGPRVSGLGLVPVSSPQKYARLAREGKKYLTRDRFLLFVCALRGTSGSLSVWTRFGRISYRESSFAFPEATWKRLIPLRWLVSPVTLCS